ALDQPTSMGSGWISARTPDPVTPTPRATLDNPCNIDEADLCPQSDSNRHLTDFKSAASANWAMGASDEFSVLTPDSLVRPLPQDGAGEVLKVAPSLLRSH